MCIYIYICIHIYIYIHVCIYTQRFTCICIHAHNLIFQNLYSMHMYVYAYTCAFLRIRPGPRSAGRAGARGASARGLSRSQG